MKPVLFVICFTLGVTLMVFSGYLPQSANARGRAGAVGASDRHAADRSVLPRTVTRRVLSQQQDDAAESDQTAAGVGLDDRLAPAITDSPTADGVAALQEEIAQAVSEEPTAEQTPANSSPAETAMADESTASADEAPLYADAGPDRIVWSGWDELTLDGSASSGRELAYHWKQASGPKALVIEQEAQAATVARGLLGDGRVGWRAAGYEFELTVTDASGAQDVDYVKYTVCSAPPLKIKPTPGRRFELRNGYQLAHFVSWVTNLETYESLFEIASPVELTITKVAGDACEVTGGKLDGTYLYQVVVYGQEGQAASWVELLVDTEDKIPGIVQLGVNWEARPNDDIDPRVRAGQ